MRLTDLQVRDIKEVISECDPDAEVFLFGSRVNDTDRGGDIDLLVMSSIISSEERRKIKIGLFDKLGEQKIDLVLARDNKKPFVRIAQREGVRL